VCVVLLCAQEYECLKAKFQETVASAPSEAAAAAKLQVEAWWAFCSVIYMNATHGVLLFLADADVARAAAACRVGGDGGAVSSTRSSLLPVVSADQGRPGESERQTTDGQLCTRRWAQLLLPWVELA